MNNTSLKLPLKNLVRPSQSDGRSPSIFLLHGFGSNMQDLYSLESVFPKNWSVISLQATIPVQFQGWAWADLNLQNLRLTNPEEMEKHEKLVFESIQQAIKILKLNPQKVNLLGFSQGASLSIISGLINPTFYNSNIALCGFLPVKDVMEKIKAEGSSSINLFMGNGIQDPIVSIELADKTYDDLKKTKYCPNL